MKLSLNWIKKYVDTTDIDDEKIIKSLMLSTAEIEEVENKGKEVEGILVGQIKSIQNVQKNISLVDVEYGDGKQESVICGATNLYEGLKVAFAPSGSKVTGMEIKEVEIYGHKSKGMICSEKELGIGEDHDGILQLDDSVKIGEDIKNIYEIDDTIFEVDNKSLTHRPDLWSHYGFAREVAAIFNRKLSPVDLHDEKISQSDDKSGIVGVENTEHCYRYLGAKINNVDNNCQTPINMRIKLFYTGMRSLNMLADLSNYVMLELGQPMHVFDGSKVQDIYVKKPSKEIEFKTLDSEIRKITENDLMIYTKTNDIPIAIAGIMGGEDTEVTKDTNSILLESATFNASTIRKTSSRLGLRTEASQRYEKSLDPELAMQAALRFLKLLKELNPEIDINSPITDFYEYKYPKIDVKTSGDYIRKYSGINDIKNDEIEGILNNLGFKSKNTDGDEITVEVPSYRATKDVSIQQDILEEITRIYGYDNIKPESIKSKITPVTQDESYEIERNIKNELSNVQGLNEVHTYIWKNEKYNDSKSISTKPGLKVVNSTVKENNELRTELIPSLIQVLDKNIKEEQEFNIYEVGRVANIENYEMAKDLKKLAIVLADSKSDYSSLYFKAKKIVQDTLLGIKNQNPSIKVEDSGVDYFHPKNQASLYIEDIKVGSMGIISPEVTSNIKKNLNIVAVEINLDHLINVDEKKEEIKPISKFPSTYLDFNFLISENILYSEFESVIKMFDTNSDIEFEFSLKDVYTSSDLGGNKSYTIQMQIFSYNRTLKNKDIELFSEEFINHMSKKGYDLKK